MTFQITAHWNRVEDQLPPLGQRVLVVWPQGDYDILTYESWGNSPIWWDGSHSYSPPLAWMELPPIFQPVEEQS